MTEYFSRPAILLLLLAVPAAAAGWRVAAARMARGLGALSRERRPPGTGLQLALLVTAASLAIVAAAGPTWGVRRAQGRREAAQIVFVMDVSRSMGAGDVPPSRLAAAQEAVVESLGHLRGQSVGVVIFGGTARLRFPLTTDLEAAAQVVQGLQPGSVLVAGGSSVAAGIEAALGAFDRSRPGGGLMVVLTDGDDLGPEPGRAAAAGREAGVRLLVAGVGTPGGARVPVYDPETGKFVDKVGPHGRPLVSVLGEGFLRELAAAAGGRYLGADLGRLPAAVAAESGLLERTRRETRSLEFPVARFQLFAIAALFVLLAGSLGRLAPWPGRRRGLAVLGATLSLALLAAGCAASAYRQNEAGRRLLAEGDVGGAVTSFYAAMASRPGDVVIARNLVRALISGERYGEAAGVARRALQGAPAEEQAEVLSLLGHAQFGDGDLSGALESFAQALVLDPGSDLLRHDYEVVLALLQESEAREGGGEGDSSSPPAGEPEPGQPGTGEPEPGGEGEGAGGATPGGSPGGGAQAAGLPAGEEGVEQRLAAIDRQVATILEGAGEPSAEEAARVLDLLAERSRISALRDLLASGSDANDY